SQGLTFTPRSGLNVISATLYGVGQLDDAAKAYRAAEAAVVRAEAAAERRVRQVREQRTGARQRLHAAMVEAARGGMRQVDIIRITGYSRDRVRTILREGGVEAGD